MLSAHKHATVQLVNSKLQEMFPASRAATSSEVVTTLEKEIRTLFEPDQSVFRDPVSFSIQAERNRAYLHVEDNSPFFDSKAALTQAAWNGQVDLVKEGLKDEDNHPALAEVFQSMTWSGTKRLDENQYQVLMTLAPIVMFLEGIDSSSSDADDLVVETARRGDRIGYYKMLNLYGNLKNSMTNTDTVIPEAIKAAIKHGHNQIVIGHIEEQIDVIEDEFEFYADEEGDQRILAVIADLKKIDDPSFQKYAKFYEKSIKRYTMKSKDGIRLEALESRLNTSIIYPDGLIGHALNVWESRFNQHQNEWKRQVDRKIVEFLMDSIIPDSIKYKNFEMFKYGTEKVLVHAGLAAFIIQGVATAILNCRGTFFDQGYRYLEENHGSCLDPRDKLYVAVRRGQDVEEVREALKTETEFSRGYFILSAAELEDSAMFQMLMERPEFRQVLINGHVIEHIRPSLTVVKFLIKSLTTAALCLRDSPLRDRMLDVGDLDSVKVLIEHEPLRHSEFLPRLRSYMTKGKLDHVKLVLNQPNVIGYLKSHSDIRAILNRIADEYLEAALDDNFSFEFFKFLIDYGVSIGVSPIFINLCFTLDVPMDQVFYVRNVRSNCLYLFEQQAQGNLTFPPEFEDKFKAWAQKEGYFELATLPDQIRDSMMKSAARL